VLIKELLNTKQRDIEFSKQFNTQLMQRISMKTTDKLADSFTMTRLDQTIAGRELMRTLPFISLNEIALLKPDQVVKYVNEKHAKWEPELPKMPCIWVYESRDGAVIYRQEQDSERRPIAKIEHYTVEDVPALPTPDKTPVPRAIFLDVMTRAVECGIV